MCVLCGVGGKGIGYPVVAYSADSATGHMRYCFEEILIKRNLNLSLWTVTGRLTVIFLVASSTKLSVPRISRLAWVAVPSRQCTGQLCGEPAAEESCNRASKPGDPHRSAERLRGTSRPGATLSAVPVSGSAVPSGAP